MIHLKHIIGNELMKEVIAIRLHTLHQLIGRYEKGIMPSVNDEGATGAFDNKGAIFIPGGLIYQDVDERFIRYDSYGKISAASFRAKIREAMRNDNATLLYPDGIACAINLDSGFFSRAARRIFAYKKTAFRRTKKIGSTGAFEISSDDIIKSHCPTYMKPPYGARTRISSCVSVGLIDPPMYYIYNKAELNLTSKRARRFVEDLDSVREKTLSEEGRVLFPPYIIVCHDTRYRKNSFTGLTRVLGIGKFGEFATFSFESLNNRLQGELQRKKVTVNAKDYVAFVDGRPIVAIVRIYEQTNPGKRLPRYQLFALSLHRDVEIDGDQIAAHASSGSMTFP
jgi:hypothetical protein